MNVDGIPMFKSSERRRRPIFWYVFETGSEKCLSALYCSSLEPDSVMEFVKSFITELKELEFLGFYSDINKKVSITKEKSGDFGSFASLGKMAE
jgi:hypothetical protein